jgi:hypothetical protein
MAMGSVKWLIFIPAMLVCCGIAWAIHHWTKLPFWASLGIVIVGLLINGWVAAIEDHW